MPAAVLALSAATLCQTRPGGRRSEPLHQDHPFFRFERSRRREKLVEFGIAEVRDTCKCRMYEQALRLIIEMMPNSRKRHDDPLVRELT
jgi:hypothetical protein